MDLWERTGVIGSIFLRGAYLLPATASFEGFSGELYMPNTSASASFVLMVTVGSGPPITVLRRPPRATSRVDLCPSSSGTEDDDAPRVNSDAGGGPHFLPSRPMERALASCIQYSIPSSVKSKDKLKRGFSGRFSGAGGASMWAYRDSRVEIWFTDAQEDDVGEQGEEELAWLP